jgi:desampylase
VQVRISSEALAAIQAHAAEDPRAEVCGLLLGQEGHVATALRTINVADDPTRQFEIDPGALIAAHRAARSGGAQLLGSYHSHPSGSAEPSSIDLAYAAADGRLWLIVAGDEVRAWVAGPDGFRPLQLVVR